MTAETRKSERKTKGVKKETFTVSKLILKDFINNPCLTVLFLMKWATPADEFAEDVASDNDDAETSVIF